MTELYQALAQGLLIGATYGLLALGMGLVYGVVGRRQFLAWRFHLARHVHVPGAVFGAVAMDPYVSIIITVPLMTAHRCAGLSSS